MTEFSVTPREIKIDTMERQIIVQDKEYQFYKLPVPERLDEMGALRVKAWKEEPGISQSFFSNAMWLDKDDIVAHHWVITHLGKIVAAARMSFHESYQSVPHADLFNIEDIQVYNKPPFASLNRLVVAPEHRGKGFSHILDEARIHYAEQHNIRTIIAQPIASRIEALEKLGFEYIGKIKPLYQMPDRQIYFMVKNLSQQRQ